MLRRRGVRRLGLSDSSLRATVISVPEIRSEFQRRKRSSAEIRKRSTSFGSNFLEKTIEKDAQSVRKRTAYTFALRSHAAHKFRDRTLP